MEKLQLEFSFGDKLKSEDLNKIVGKINEIVDFVSKENISHIAEIGLDVDTERNLLVTKDKEYSLKEYQPAESVKVYSGILSSDITGFDSKASAVVSNITSAFIQEAILNESIVEFTADTQQRVETEHNFDYYIGLVREDVAYKLMQFDGVEDYIPFVGDSDQCCNGEISVVIEGVTYKLYAQYAPLAGTTFNIQAVAI